MIINSGTGKYLVDMMSIGMFVLGAIMCPICAFMIGGIEQWLLIVLIVGAIISLIVAIAIARICIKNSNERDKIVSKLLKYKKFMVATNQYTIFAIAEEFEEPVEEVEKFIQNAIDEHILYNVYLSKKTKELLLINKKPTFNKAKINQQNVNVENNVIINENTTK